VHQQNHKNTPRKKTSHGNIAALFFENKEILRFCILFSVFLGGFTVLLDMDFLQLYVVAPHLRQVAFCSGTTIQLLGTSCTISETSILSSRFSVNVVQGCDSIYPTAMLWAALLAYPSTWRSKMIGIIGGASILFAVNIIRIVTMFYIGMYIPSLFDMVHIYAWQALFILLTLAVWLLWAAKFSKTPISV